MVDDVRLAVEGRVAVRFYGRCGGKVVTPPEMLEHIEKAAADAGAGRIGVPA